MKRFLYILICLFLSVSFVCCSPRKTQPPPQGGEEKKQEGGTEEKEDKPDKKEGQELLDNYLRALILRDSNKIKFFYSESLRQASGDFKPADNPHPNGYKSDKVDEKEGKLEGKATIFSVFTGEPYFSADESSITITKEKGSYVIDKIEKSKSTEVSEKDRVLYIREGGDVKGKELIKLDELPRFATPQGAPPDHKLPIGRDKFGPLAMDPDSKKIAVSTIGQYPALLVIDVKEKKADPLDLYLEGSVQTIAWSQDGKFLAVEMSNPQGARFINVYEADKGKKVDDPMREAMRQDKFSVNTPYWISENELVFNVSAVAGAAPDEQKKSGSYKFDVKNLSLTKF